MNLCHQHLYQRQDQVDVHLFPEQQPSVLFLFLRRIQNILFRYTPPLIHRIFAVAPALFCSRRQQQDIHHHPSYHQTFSEAEGIFCCPRIVRLIVLLNRFHCQFQGDAIYSPVSSTILHLLHFHYQNQWKAMMPCCIYLSLQNAEQRCRLMLSVKSGCR